MALQIDTLKTRSFTALIFVIVMLCGLLINYWTFFILFSIIHFGCWFEYQKIVGLINKSYSSISTTHKYLVMLCGWGFMLFMCNPKFQFQKIFITEIGKWLSITSFSLLILSEIFTKNSDKLKNLFNSLLGLLYISLSLGLMIHLRNHGMLFKGKSLFFDFGFALPILLIASIWINDTMAYLVGSLIGKNPLSSISPKKTWEGTIGGAILCVALISFLVSFYIDHSLFYLALTVSTLASIFGTLGDLLESKLKRLANIKDSGSFMPGHGGFLDRFDSLLIATPTVCLAIYCFFS